MGLKEEREDGDGVERSCCRSQEEGQDGDGAAVGGEK